MAAQKNKATLDAMWATMMSLGPESTKEEHEKLHQYFEPDALVYLNGMTAPPTKSHAGILEETLKLVGYWKMEKKTVTHEIVSADGKKIVATMLNHLKIIGQDVENFNECEVTIFSDKGLIKEYLLYVDPSAIMEVFKKSQAA